MKVSVTGFRELDAALAEIEKQATRRTVAIRALTKGADPMQQAIYRLAPVDDGDPDGVVSRDAIAIAPRAVKANGRRTKRGGSGGEFGDSVEVFIGYDTAADPKVNIYGPMNEFGLGHQPSQPHFRPGFEAVKFASLEHIKSALAADIEATAARAARKKARG